MKQLRYFQTYLEEVYGIIHVEEIKRTHIKHFLSMMDEKKRKPQYINDLLKVFKTFFRYDKRFSLFPLAFVMERRGFLYALSDAVMGFDSAFSKAERKHFFKIMPEGNGVWKYNK